MKRNFKRILACTVAALLLFSTAAFAVPLMQFNSVLVEVSTADELHDALTSGAAGRTIQLTNNITASNWIPVAISDTAIGNFMLDGNGHTITLSVQPGFRQAGLLGYLNGANVSIRNLGIVNHGIMASIAESSTYAGGLIGLARNSIVNIDQSFVTGTFVEADRPNAGGHDGFATAGGLVGQITNGTSLTITNSFAMTDVSALIFNRSWLPGTLRAYAGGLLGSRLDSDNITVNYSYFVGNVLASVDGTLAHIEHRHTGGIVGRGPANDFNTSAYVAHVTFGGGSGNRNRSGTELSREQLRNHAALPSGWIFAPACTCDPCNPYDESDYVCACGCQTGIWQYREGVNDGFPVLRGFEDTAFFVMDFVSSLFQHDSTEYNHRLATWAMQLAYRAYRPRPHCDEHDENVSDCSNCSNDPIWMTLPSNQDIYSVLEEHGFDREHIARRNTGSDDATQHTFAHRNITIYSNIIGMEESSYDGLGMDSSGSWDGLGNSRSTTTNSVGTYNESILDDTRPLVVIAIRGSGTNNDWVVNFATQFNFVNCLSGSGTFIDAKNVVYQNLITYLNEHGLIDQNPKFLITGHSHGAAVGNLLAAHLNNLIIPSGDCEENDCDAIDCDYCIIIRQSDVFAYTFATPHVHNPNCPCDRSNDDANIFNILNQNDVVAFVPHSIINLSGWNNRWSRNGVDLAINMPFWIFSWLPVGLFGHLPRVYSDWMESRHNLTFAQIYAIAASNRLFGNLPWILSWKCPVDITIYDDDGNMVAQIINDEVVLIDGSPVFAWITDDGEKNFFLPYGVELSHAHIVARDHGTMLFAAATVCASDPEPVEMKLFEDVILQPGVEFIVPLSRDIDIPDIQLLIMEDGEIVGEVMTDGSVAVTGIDIYNEGDVRILTVGQTHQLAPIFTPEIATNRTVFWTTSNSDVATISNHGLVTAHAPGSVIITLTTLDGGFRAQMILTVQVETEISILGSPTRILTVDQQHQLTTTVTPNSTAFPITWSSSNDAVAAVSAEGVLIAVSPGNAIITATTADGSLAQVAVTVELETGITIPGDPARILTLSQQEQLLAVVTPTSTSHPISWSSSNPEVAFVDQDGLVLAMSTGSAIITASTADGFVAQVMIAVEVATEIAILGEPTRILTIGQQQQLTATVTNNSTSLPLAWSSSNEAVATVSANGMLMAVSPGNAIISATTQDGFSAQVVVTVQPETEISIVGAAIRILNPGQLQQLTATATPNPTAHPIVWASSDETVATVDQSGAITAHALGVSIVSATTQDGISAQIIVTVEPPTVVAIAGEPIRTITAGQSLLLAVEVTQNSTALPLTWTSSDTTIATVNQSGRITAHEPGTAVITVTTQDGVTAQVVVQVEPEPEPPSTWQVIWQWLSNTVAWLGRAFAWIMPIVGFFAGLGWLIWLM